MGQDDFDDTTAMAAGQEAMDAAERAKVLQHWRSMVEKQYETPVFTLDEPPRLVTGVIPTGIPQLDAALGVGGLPKGAMVELYGVPGVGKTALALFMSRSVLNSGGGVLFVDAEHALDAELAKLMGIDLDVLVVTQPVIGENALAIVESGARAGCFQIIILDSIAALVPRDVLKDDMLDRAHPAAVAKLLAQVLPRIVAVAKQTGTIVILINQLRERPSLSWGARWYTPGGNAMKFYAAIRLSLSRGAAYREGDLQVGHEVNIYVAKNKFAPPFRRCAFDLSYYTGLGWLRGTIPLLIERGLLIQKGSHYYLKHPDPATGEFIEQHFLGQDALLEHLLTVPYEQLQKWIAPRKETDGAG